MYAVLGLPSLTVSCARGANPIGAFGLVGQAVTNCYHGLACAGRRFLVGLDPVTNPYHPPDLAWPRVRITFTNLYHRDGETHTGTDIVARDQHQATGWAGL